jgi:hypothetical protein
VNTDNPLVAIVCGYEKSGTTLLNEILRQHPKLDSGFECGFLLGDSPRAFPGIQPYHSFFRQKWQLDREDMSYICAADDWAECYRRARERSPVIADKETLLFDKTPIYMLHLSDVMTRVPNIPCVVNVRDPRALMLSWANWSGHREDPESCIRDNFEDYCERYLSYAEGYAAAMEKYPQRILLNQFERLCLDPTSALTDIFNFMGFDFDEAYLSFTSDHFVYGNTVSQKYLYPYRTRLSSELCDTILAGTKAWSKWHFTDRD